MTVNKIRVTEVDELMALVDSDRNIAEGIKLMSNKLMKGQMIWKK